MPRSHALPLWALIPGLLLSGCESDTFMPPPNPELAAPAPPPPVRVVEMILPTQSTPGQNALAQYLRLFASREKTSYRTSAPEPNDPPKSQADLIRKAAERGASVLIVQPDQDAAVTKALDEVRAQGVPSLLLAKPLSESGQGKPFPIVEAAPFSDVAGKLVDAAVEAAKAAKLPADGTGVVLTAANPDADLKNCADALTLALQNAKIASPEPLNYDGTPEGAKSALTKRLEADPKLAIILVAEQVGLTAVLDARNKLKDKRPIVVAGYAPIDPSGNEMLFSQTAAMAVRNLTQLAREAFKAALRLADGDAVPDQTAVPDEFQLYPSKYVEPTPEPTAGFPKAG